MGQLNKSKLASVRPSLSFESIEPRRLMAVTTSLDASGNLTVTGDAAADKIAIFGTSNPGEFTIQGDGTTVDGGACATIAGVSGNLIVNLAGGNDVLNMDNVYLAGNLTVNTGDADDIVIFGATGVVSSQGNCTVETAQGFNDEFRAHDYKVFIGGGLIVRDGNFDSKASLIGASASGGISIQGNSEVLMRGVTSGSLLEVRSSSNVNNIAIFTSAANGDLRVVTPSGQNSIYIDTCYSAVRIDVQCFSPFLPSIPHDPEVPPFNIDATITIARCSTRQVFVDTTGINFRPTYSGGNDTLQLYGNYIAGPAANPAGELTVRVDTGDGRDNVSASYNIVLDEFFARLAQLDDSLVLVGNQVTGLMNGDGGTGTNRLTMLGNQFGATSFSFFQ
jgi:hypothetical protein